MQTEVKNELLRMLLENLELPGHAYEKAKSRYEDLGEWLCRQESLCREYEPNVFSQGSFRLGTAIKPIKNEHYDLDLVCKLASGIDKGNHTQKDVKDLLGGEVNAYRIARGIEEEVEAKHRCWCLNYSDEVSFHMDIVPCIPETEMRVTNICENMVRFGAVIDEAKNAAGTTVAITDDRHPKYDCICDDWGISNPEGYAAWFESRMKLTPQDYLRKQAEHYVVESVDKLPIYKWKTPLQQAVQVLKRHRDQMFDGNTEQKPISIIITTLAARAYQGEPDLSTTLDSILSKMGEFVNKETPRVPNPVDPEEDFADKWPMPKYNHLQLEQNFWNWLQQAQIDFATISNSEDARFVTSHALRKLAVSMDEQNVAGRLGLSIATTTVMGQPKAHKIIDAPKPWTR